MRVSNLPFKVIDCRTEREYTEDAVIKDGYADGLMEMDLNGFMICEDGCLAYGDECGTYNYVNTIGKYEIKIDGYAAIDEVLEIIHRYRRNTPLSTNQVDVMIRDIEALKGEQE